MSVLSYLDVVLVVVAAPIMLLIGVPAAAYAIAAGAWIALRGIGAAAEHYATATSILKRVIAIRLGYMLGRLFALAIAIILIRKSDGQDAGLTALAVIVFAFTIQLATSAITRPKSR